MFLKILREKLMFISTSRAKAYIENRKIVEDAQFPIPMESKK
jgi:hypothetical protein